MLDDESEAEGANCVANAVHDQDVAHVLDAVGAGDVALKYRKKTLLKVLVWLNLLNVVFRGINPNKFL